METNQLLLPGGRQSGDSAVAATAVAGILSTKVEPVSGERSLPLSIHKASTGTPVLGPGSSGSPQEFAA